ncbi:hypothetical protein QQG55_42730 [Brugia pahangi]
MGLSIVGHVVISDPKVKSVKIDCQLELLKKNMQRIRSLLFSSLNGHHRISHHQRYTSFYNSICFFQGVNFTSVLHFIPSRYNGLIILLIL